MYLEHFGLREAPFRITPHTEFFFFWRQPRRHARSADLRDHPRRGNRQGQWRSGQRQDHAVPDVARKASGQCRKPSTSPTRRCPRDEIFQTIAEELHAPLPESHSHLSLRALQQRLIEIHASGRQVVVMVDEAHAMPAETLEEIRLLSNLETSRHKLVHIVLFGQRELDEHLRQAKHASAQGADHPQLCARAAAQRRHRQLPDVPPACRRLSRPQSVHPWRD